MLYALPQPLSPSRRNVELRPAAAPFLARDRSNSYSTFLEDLREFIAHRLDRVNPYRESKEYGLQMEKASNLYERLRESLPEEGRSLLLQYSETLGAAHYLETALMAEKAFLDGVRIAIGALTDESSVEL